MKHYLITITTAKGRTEISGLFSSSFAATLAGMDHLDESDPQGRIEVKPA
jgi:hypothetical protein